MLSSSTVTTNLVLAGFAVATAVSSNTTHTEKDSAQLEGITQQMVASAATSAMGVDPWRGTAIDTLRRQLAEAAKSNSLSTSEKQFEDEDVYAGSENVNGDCAESECEDEFECIDLISTVTTNIVVDSTNRLEFTKFSKNDESLDFRAQWQDGIIEERDELGLIVTTNVSFNVQGASALIAKTQIPASCRAVEFSLPRIMIPEEWEALGVEFRLMKLLDSDGDGILDYIERDYYHTDPNDSDSDGDGLNDGWEILHNTDPQRRDSDGDGLDDRLELALGTNPSLADSDNDGLNDGFEIGAGSDPSNPDTDGDGEKDGDEYEQGRDPLQDEEEALVDPPSGASAGVITGNAVSSFSWDVDVDDDVETPNLEVTIDGSGGVSWGTGNTYPFHMSVGGLYFVPSVSGLYEISLTADDNCEASVGSIVVEDHYYGPHGEPKLGFLKAGQHYGISVSHDNLGGPSNFALSASLAKVYREKFVNNFNPNVVIYEDGYENKPGNMVPKNSTYAVCDFVVAAGPEGGKLTISGNYNNALELYAGTDIPPGEYELGPFETKKCHGIFRGQTPSTTDEDVFRIVNWRPNDGGSSIVTTNVLTVVRVNLMADAATPTNQHRHEFGVCEGVTLDVSPVGVGLTVNAGELSFTNYSGKMPNSISNGNITVSVSGVSLVLPWKSLTPSRRKAEACWSMIADSQWVNAFLPPISRGMYGAGMICETTLLPNYVSFLGLHFCEGECGADGFLGVLSDDPSRDDFHHGTREGAWKDIAIGSDNFSGDDTVAFVIGFADGLPPSCISGYSFVIPEYWSEENTSNSDQRHWFHNETQTHTLYPNGSATVRKFGRGVRRFANGNYDPLYDLQ